MNGTAARLGRKSGILLHPTSLPGPLGIGDLGPAAFAFVDFLVAAGQSHWQVMPLGPTGYGDSPYQNLSAFAGNPMLISLELLIKDGLLSADDLATMPVFPPGKVDFEALLPWKKALLKLSFDRFQGGAAPHLRQELGTFGANHHHWVNDYALFAALKEHHGGEPWNKWDAPLRRRDPAALAKASQELRAKIQFQVYLQFLFDRQWSALRAYATSHKITLIGDIPIFVAYDSADVWSNPEQYWLDEEGQLLYVAGVPPDYFSKTGQRWGNPLYRWDAMQRRGYDWWIARFRALLGRVDIVRLDHFRGFAAYWEIPAEEDTAINGRWVTGPGRALFDAVFGALGSFPIIAEDLGVITPDVEALRDGLGLPGMRILQFAFGGTQEAPYLPHNHVPNCVVYTGTHDNDTTAGWWKDASPAEHQHLSEYLGHTPTQESISWDLTRLALSSTADTVLLPMQDLLSLGSDARMNTPSRPSGNWGWRLLEDALTLTLAKKLKALTLLYGRFF